MISLILAGKVYRSTYYSRHGMCTRLGFVSDYKEYEYITQTITHANGRKYIYACGENWLARRKLAGQV